MRVVITGATGRIGRAIYVRLARSHDVVGVDRAPSSTADVVGDITEGSLLDRAMAGADAVVHVASLHAPQVGHVAEAAFERINVAGTQRVLQAAQRMGLRHIVFTSTTALYGGAGDGAASWLDEDSVPRPRSIYHRTKLAAEALLLQAAQPGRLAVTVLRMGRCFPEPAPAMALYRLHRGIDARDVASAHELALAQPPERSSLYVIAGATPFQPADAPALLHAAPALLRERAPALAAAFDARGWPLPPSIDRVYCPNRAIAELGWQPRFGFDEVLRQLDEESSEVLPPKRSGH